MESNGSPEWVSLRWRITDLEKSTEALKRVIVGQTASIAMLCTLLAQGGKLSAMDAKMVMMAGVEAQDYKGLAAGDITKWAVTQMEKHLGGD